MVAENAELYRENKGEMWVENKKGGREGMEEESEDPSCMNGVSGRFLRDTQVEAWSQRSTEATDAIP